MIKGVFPVEQFRQQDTPFYYYDMALLRKTLDALTAEIEKYGYHQHYAVKANANPHILSAIAARGFGADCVSGGEIEAALACGFPASKIVFAGVGKVIDGLAAERKQTARVALRVNPDIDAHTHAKITTGLQENKFGINLSLLPRVFAGMRGMKHVRFTGLHFHIGSQITDMSAFRDMCIRSNDLQDELEAQGIAVGNVNFGGGLGIDYHHPNHLDVPDFESYFAVFHKLVRHRPGQQIHFELGRSVVGQCGSLISRVLYVKEGETKKFAVLDAGFTELLRPAFYDAYHRIENITSNGETDRYDVVGPVCESSDVFGKEVELNEVHRNDLIAFRSAGAYGEVMAMRYNCRPLPKAFFSDRLP